MAVYVGKWARRRTYEGWCERTPKPSTDSTVSSPASARPRAKQTPSPDDSATAWSRPREDRPRPVEAVDRAAVAGDWKGDLIIGLHRSVIGTLVDVPRGSRSYCTCHAWMATAVGPGCTTGRRWLATAPKPAEMRSRSPSPRYALPGQLCRTLTWDRGRVMAQHVQLTADTGMGVFFADPHSPGGAARTRTPTACAAVFSQGHRPLSRWTRHEVTAIAAALNNRSRSALGWKSPNLEVRPAPIHAWACRRTRPPGRWGGGDRS